MADFARSAHPAVQAQLDRLSKLSPAGDRLGLERIGAVLDRNGLRPSRYYVTKDDLVIMASEAGVLPVAPERVARLTHLKPGAVLGTQELADARQNLDAVGLFDDIRITLDSTRSDDGDGTTNVNVAVVEGTSNELRTKIGYGTLDCFRLQLQASRAAVLASA